MKALVEAGEIEVTIHHQLNPSPTKPSFVIVKQNDKMIAYEQFAPYPDAFLTEKYVGNGDFNNLVGNDETP